MAASNDYPLVWVGARRRLPERRGEPCRIVARGAMGSVQVEFQAERYTVITSWRLVRKASGQLLTPG
ncbi:MAG: hypothetical protein ABI401_13380 [Candidatus Dormibacter sp.]